MGRDRCNYWIFFRNSISNVFFNFLGKKIRKEFPKGSTLVEFIRKKFGKSLFKLILLMTIFYMFIFLCAEVTAVAVLINYISGTELWKTALIVLLSTLIYTLYGGLKLRYLQIIFK